MLGSGAQGLGFAILSLGFRDWALGFRIQDIEFTVFSLEFKSYRSKRGLWISAENFVSVYTFSLYLGLP